MRNIFWTLLAGNYSLLSILTNNTRIFPIIALYLSSNHRRNNYRSISRTVQYETMISYTFS